MRMDLDLSDVPVSTKGRPLPPGYYRVCAEKVERKMGAQSGDTYYNFEFNVVEEGPHKGKKLYKIAMVTGKSQKWGLHIIKELALAIGHPNPNFIGDTSELTKKICYAKVANSTQAGYEHQNVIKGFISQAEHRLRFPKQPGQKPPPDQGGRQSGWPAGPPPNQGPPAGGPYPGPEGRAQALKADPPPLGPAPKTDKKTGPPAGGPDPDPCGEPPDPPAGRPEAEAGPESINQPVNTGSRTPYEDYEDEPPF
jgi:hypothetical protein